MSAWFVSKAHIDALVTYALDHAIRPKPDGTALGRLLWEENAKSLRYRYSDADKAWDLADAQTYVFRPAYVSSVDVFKAAQSYDYQSCEHPEWPTSDAKRIVDVIQASILLRLGATEKELTAFGPYGPRNPLAAAYNASPGSGRWMSRTFSATT